MSEICESLIVKRKARNIRLNASIISIGLNPMNFWEWAQLGTIQRPPDYESGALTSWAMGPCIIAAKGLQFYSLFVNAATLNVELTDFM